VLAEKHKVLQILVNLITNAQQAMDGTPLENRTLAITVAPDSAGHAAKAWAAWCCTTCSAKRGTAKGASTSGGSASATPIWWER
jgi:hypothetical protein